MLAKIRHYVPYDTLLNIYYAIFNSHLIYGCQIWGQHKSQLLEKLNIIQNKALRIINFKSPRDHADPLYHHSKILKLNDHISLMNCLFAYDQHKQNLPGVFKDYFVPVSEIHDHNTRATEKQNFSIPQSKTLVYGLHSIKHQCISIWNKMQNNLKTEPNQLRKPELNKILFEHFLNTYS